MSIHLRSYKYMRREYADALVNHGRIRIGTAYEYLRADKLGSEIGDYSEGACFFEIKRNEMVTVASDTNGGRMARWIRAMLHNSPESSNFETFIVGFRDVDVFMYCVSTVYDPRAMAQLGYDSCVEIVDSYSFLSSITRSITGMSNYVGTAACDYRGRGFTYWEAGTFAPYLLKEQRYAYQCEVRSVWQPNQKWLVEAGKLTDLTVRHPLEDPLPTYILEPLILEIPAIVGSVRIIS